MVKQLTLSPLSFLIVCPLVFLAGFVDAIGGGGGIISLPAYMLAGLPAHTAVATNKLSSCCGTAIATGRFIKNKLVSVRLAVPTVIAAVVGSSAGAKISLFVDEKVFRNVLAVLLPVIALTVLNKKTFSDSEKEFVLNKRTYLTAVISALVIGMYDGFYGPGTGTFLIIAFTVFAGVNAVNANAHAKVINLTTNITSLVIFLINGKVLIPLGLAAAVCNMAGGYIGSGMVIKNSNIIVRPVIIIVLILLLLKVTGLI